MPRGGRLAAWGAVLLATLLLGGPAGAQSAPQSANQPAATVQTGDAGAAEPQPTEADPDDAAPAVEVVRYDGSDPYAMSIELVASAGGTSEWVVLASGENWAEAAAAGPLAASLGAPVLLVPPGGLQTSAARPDLVEFLKSAGVRRVVIVGNPEVLPNHEPSVLYGLGMLPRNIERVHGTDPIGASVAVAERVGTPAEFGELGRTVIIASHRSVADAVTVGPLAAAGPFPLLLTAPDALDPRITAYLTAHEIAHVVLVGGTTAIAPEVHEAIEAADITVTRLAGRDRSDTSRFAANLFEQHTTDDPTCADGTLRIGLALARHPEQALIAGPLLAQQCASLRYTEPGELPAELPNTLYLARQQAQTMELHLFASETDIPVALVDESATSTPPFRLVFGTQIRRDYGREAVIASVDQHHNRRLYLEGERFDWTDWLNWSPDGRHLAFGGSQEGTSGAFLLDTATGEYRRITPASDDFYFSNWAQPSWSPSGDYLAMSTQTYALYRSDIKGQPRGVDLFVFDMQTGEFKQLTNGVDEDVFRGWSPDGEWMLLERGEVWIFPPGLRPPGGEYFLVSPSSGVVKQLELDGQAIGHWSWAPNGELAAIEIAEPYDPTYATPEVAIAATEDLPHVQLMLTGSEGHISGWSDDGKYLAVISDYTRAREFSIVDSQFELVAEPASFARGTSSGFPSYRGWQPRSHRVLMEQYRYPPGLTEDLALFDVDTGELTAIPLGEAQRDYVQFTFAPDGSQFAAVVREGDRSTRHVVVHDVVALSTPFSLIDLSEYTPPTEEITTVHIRWLDVGIRGTIEWHYDF